jgi:Transglycosylase SLT domain
MNQRQPLPRSRVARRRPAGVRSVQRRSRQAWRRRLQVLRRAPRGVRWLWGVLLLAAAALLVNVLFQVVRKPSELFFPVATALNKTPEQTWQQYGAAFRAESTAVISPTFLAALAQTEASGNPIARTYWRFSWSAHPFDIYRPASSAVGMYQLTDGTFEQARQLCIRDHQVAHQGAWNDWSSCWFNHLYMRILPLDAIEMTSAYLDESVRRILTHHALPATLERKQRLAAIVHLCGEGAADRFARQGFRWAAGQACGAERPEAYVSRVQKFQRRFEQLAAAG